MDSQNKVKKAERKLKRLQHVLFKEMGISCVTSCTNHLAILNAGLVSGLSEELVFEHFSKFGTLKQIILIPGKSCSFVSFTDVNFASNALKHCNGKLNIAQGQKPIYLSYVENLPNTKSKRRWDQVPPGLIVLENFVTDEEETALLEQFDLKEDLNQGDMKHRKVRHYGFEFRYDINNVDKDKPMDVKVPSESNFLWDRLRERMDLNFRPDQLTVNKYNPGQGIPHHIDTHSAFEDPIISLSLQSSVIMEFKRGEEHLCVLLPRKSLAVISGESRYDWTHGITPRRFDIVYSRNGYTSLERGVRVSLTFRKILQGKCNCIFRAKCDSYSSANECNMENSLAHEIEKLHVHRVYENIASHFSDTRHKPWPNVLKFVQSFVTGAILVDIGCGNGKYLGQNKCIFDIGCDQNSVLIGVCKERGFEALTANCLNIPMKNDIADGIISIAVIHHLANEERRLLAVKEMVRVLRVGGRALIYVWAKDQQKDQQKSSYIKQDRKNRKNDATGINDSISEEVVVLQSVSLPVHTNRTQFKNSDLLVPWKLKSESDNEKTFLRYYHVFEENELRELVLKVGSIEIVETYYDQGNWCVVIKKV